MDAMRTLTRATVILCGALISTAAEKGELRTNLGDTPWDAAALDDSKVIYGDDDRIDVYQETDPAILTVNASVCGLLDGSQIQDNGNGTFTFDTFAYEIGGDPACAGEPFGAQPTAVFCTGFLVGDDLIATAGHCYSESNIASTFFVFGFEMEDAFTPVTLVDADQLYQGIEVVGRALSGDNDFCLIRVDRDVTAPGAQPLQIRREGATALNSQVGVIGHPSGLPKKIAFGAQTTVLSTSNSFYFESNLDTYGGNSGSPVFAADSLVVEGILVRGAPDFVFQPTCFESNVLADEQGSEECTRTTVFAGLVPELVPENPGPAVPYYHEAGDHFEVTIGGEVDDGQPIQWFKDASPLSDDSRISGTQTATLVIDPLEEGDSGTYSATYDDGSKAAALFGPFSILVVPQEALPAAGMIALGVLAGSLAGAAAVRKRRAR